MCEELGNSLVAIGGFYDLNGTFTPNAQRNEVELFSPATGSSASCFEFAICDLSVAIARALAAHMMLTCKETQPAPPCRMHHATILVSSHSGVSQLGWGTRPWRS